MNTKVNPSDLGLTGKSGNHTVDITKAPQTLLTALFVIAGALAVIFIIIGGIQYVVSAGDPKKTAQAKNTILYAVIGLVIVFFAGVIVNFITGNL